MTVDLLLEHLKTCQREGLGDCEVVLDVCGCESELLVIQSNPEKHYPVILIGERNG